MKKRKTYHSPTMEQVSLSQGDTLLATSDNEKYDGNVSGGDTGDSENIGYGGESGDKEDFEINSKENWGSLWGE